jgi:FAD:protein FMN transferase
VAFAAVLVALAFTGAVSARLGGSNVCRAVVRVVVAGALDGPLLRLPHGIRLDLGATAKGLGTDRAVRAAMAATGGHGGVLVSLGGDIAVAGTPPRDGWPVTVAEEPDPGGGPGGQLVRLAAGTVATSSVTVRRWHRGGIVLHHIVDPRTGRPADGPARRRSWRGPRRRTGWPKPACRPG